MRGISLDQDETRIFKLFADGETDPHRVRSWRVVVSRDGLTLEPSDEPGSEGERYTATWHELHDVMTVRLQLLAEIEDLQAEIANLQRLQIHERTHWRRLRQLCDNRQAQLDAMPAVADAEVADVMVLRLHKLGVTWRLRRHEDLNVERILVLLPMFQTKPHLLDKWLKQLLDAGVLATSTPALTLIDSAR